MREFQERRKVRKFLHSRYTIAILIVILFIVGHAVFSVYQKYEKSKDIVNRMSGDLAELKNREQALNHSIGDLSTTEGKDRELVDRFGVVKQGEKLIVLVDDTNTTNNDTVSTSTDSWWNRLIGLFGF